MNCCFVAFIILVNKVSCEFPVFLMELCLQCCKMINMSELRLFADGLGKLFCSLHFIPFHFPLLSCNQLPFSISSILLFDFTPVRWGFLFSGVQGQRDAAAEQSETPAEPRDSRETARTNGEDPLRTCKSTRSRKLLVSGCFTWRHCCGYF